MILNIYRTIGILGAPFILTFLKRRLKLGKEDPIRFKERLGITKNKRPEGRLIWFHAASVGESLSLLPLISRVKADYPEFKLLITTGTTSSAHLMAERLPKGVIHQYVPLDRRPYVEKFLDHWRPNLVLWAESEFWPNLIFETAKSGALLVLVQGRMSVGAFKNWQWLSSFIDKILSKFVLCLAQSEQDGDRLRALGATQVKCKGNLKLSTLPLPFNQNELTDLKRQLKERTVWLAASTHPAEEETVWAAHQAVKKEVSNLLTIIVPRHAQRGSVIAKNLTTSGAVVAVRSKKEDVTEDTDLYVADTIGELGLFYRLVEIVFIGKSLVNLGGQNLIEPAQLRNAIIHGPYMWNFSSVVNSLQKKEAIVLVSSAGELADKLIELIGNSSVRDVLAHRAFEFTEKNKDIVDRLFKELDPFFREVRQVENKTQNS